MSELNGLETALNDVAALRSSLDTDQIATERLDRIEAVLLDLSSDPELDNADDAFGAEWHD